MISPSRRSNDLKRLRQVAAVFLLLAAWIIARLFMLQIVQREHYSLFALNTHEISRAIHPHRGEIFFQDSRGKKEYPAAVNREYYLLYAVPREIPAGLAATTSARLAEILGIADSEKRVALAGKLADSRSVYAVVARKVPEEISAQIKNERLAGIYAVAEEYRYYPEERLAGPALGFTSLDEHGTLVGKYGLEGYWDKRLLGSGGFQSGERGALGGWIALAGRKIIPAQDGPSALLTLDRTLEFKACQRLAEGLAEYQAKSGSLVLMSPKTGAILAMCSVPDFDPNNYSQIKDLAAFNNTAIFTPYEPGSVFKSFTMAAGLDAGIVSPLTTYTDPCERLINGHRVRNAERKCYGAQTMTQVLEKSINTGVVWVQEQLGNERFRQYLEKFGFGEKTGIELNTEAPGDISSLRKKGQIFGANGSFGQGLTATPLQLAAAYAAIASGGKWYQPYIVEEWRYPNGKQEHTKPKISASVISERSAKLLTGMLISVVENHYHAARIPGYYVAGKTGTAQISESGGYSATRTNHTFAGFAPADDPQFVLVVKYEEPQRQWAEQTALPVFRDIMKFALDYYEVPVKR